MQMTLHICRFSMKKQKRLYLSCGTCVKMTKRIIMSDHVDIEFQVCYSNF